jgi:hypothetical protein
MPETLLPRRMIFQVSTIEKHKMQSISLLHGAFDQSLFTILPRRPSAPMQETLRATWSTPNLLLAWVQARSDNKGNRMPETLLPWRMIFQVSTMEKHKMLSISLLHGAFEQQRFPIVPPLPSALTPEILRATWSIPNLLLASVQASSDNEEKCSQWPIRSKRTME